MTRRGRQSAISRRAALGVIGAGGGALISFACAPARVSVGAPTLTTVGPTAGSAPGAPKIGGTLRWGVPDAIVTLDGHFQSQGSDSIGLVFDQLTIYDDKLQPQPMLAESWDFSD